MKVTKRECPVEPEHGPVLAWADNPKYGWRCPDQAHDGRPASHPDGAAPITRSLFTTAEVEAGTVAS